MRITALVLSSALVLAACGGGSNTSGPGPLAQTAGNRAELGDTFTLKPGDQIDIGATGLRVTFTNVSNDSRCPTDVVCVWAGDAQVALSIALNGANNAAVLHTGIDPRSVTVGSYTVRLMDLTPGTRAGQTIPQQDYRASIQVK